MSYTWLPLFTDNEPVWYGTSPPTPASVPYCLDNATLLPNVGVTLLCVTFEPVAWPVRCNKLSFMLNWLTCAEYSVIASS